MHGIARIATILVLLLTSIAVIPVSLAVAQEDGPITIELAGLTNPRGLTWNGDGQLLVAEAGLGGETTSEQENVAPPTGPYAGGSTAAVVASANGCRVVVAENLPSARAATGEMIGAADVAVLGDRTFALIAAGGGAHAHPDQPAGVYEIAGNGAVTLFADLSRWVRENPVAILPETEFDPEGSWVDMIASEDGEELLIVESNSEQVVSLRLDGSISRVADFSDTNLEPTSVALAPRGGIYVGFLSPEPFTPGSAKVVKVNPNGTVEDIWTGLTMVTGIAVAPDGVLFATELAEGRDHPPYVTQGTGRIVRQTGEDSFEAVVTGIDQPSTLAIGPDGALYVSTPAIGANDGEGMVIRVSPPGDGASIQFDPQVLVRPACDGEAALGGATPTEVTDSDSPVVSGGDAATEIIIRIFDFGFDPAEVTVPVGATVMWVNTGATQHTTVSFVGGDKLWDSAVLEPGGTFQATFTQAGIYDYVCGLHPTMAGRVIAQ